MLLGTNFREATIRGLSKTQTETDSSLRTRGSDTHCVCLETKYTTFAVTHLGSHSAF